AFLDDDRSRFRHHIQAISQRPDWAKELIPRNRRAAFFSIQDTELRRVLQTTLPLMAEWGDDDSAQALRQIWLQIIIDETQTLLRNAPESAQSEELQRLYRLASRLLDDHPRGYAQQIGAQDISSSALILGTVELSALPPIEKAPIPRLQWP